MEIVLFICMMIVPVLSVIALVLAITSHRRFKALKELTIQFIKETRAGDKAKSSLAMDEFRVNEL